MIFALQTDDDYIKERLLVLNVIKDYPDSDPLVINEEIKYMENILRSNTLHDISR